MKWVDVKIALETNGKCSINNCIFTMTHAKDKIGRTLTHIGGHEIDTKIPGSDENWITILPPFNSYDQFRYWLARKNFIED